MKGSNFSKVKYAFVAATALLLALSFYSYKRVNKLINTSAWVNHTNVVKFHLGNTFSLLSEMESNQRGYILTKDTSFLQPYYNNAAAIQVSLHELDSLTSDNSSQLQNIDTLRQLVNKRKDYMQSLLEDVGSQPITLQKILGGKVMMDKVRAQINTMTAEEDRLLALRTEELNKETYLNPIVAIILTLIALLILLLAYYKITFDLKASERLKGEVERTNKELELKNEELKQNQERFFKLFDNNPVALTFGELGTNEVIYANKNFYEYFGYGPEEVIGHNSDDLGLVSPEENARLVPIILSYLDENRSVAELQALPPEETAEILLKLREKMMGNGFEVLYTRKNKETFYALVFFEVIEMGNKKYALTSYEDISDRKNSEKLVQQKNEELVKINKELESFNYISSHDLQEPLRKIQTFTSMIAESEYGNLSENGKSVFHRIQNSALKMQTLIQDLLSYSRTSIAERKLEYADIKEITDDVKEELKETINQKNAIVDTGENCKVMVIPFQFRQLIYNLMNNSLKFSTPDRVPHILINSEIKQGINFQNDNLENNTTYCHIRVSDNGIGFEPQYSDKIFEVFQRLHKKNEYSGTGIGLAIVKKIVENHNGIITTRGEPNKGATFDIYFPAT